MKFQKTSLIGLETRLAVMLGGIFKELSAIHGEFEYAMVKHGRTVVVGLKLEEGYLIFLQRRMLRQK